MATRTPDQLAADAALTEAVDRTIAAYRDQWDPDGNDGRPEVLTSYIVLTASQSWDEHGNGTTAYGALLKDGDLPIHEVLGLIDRAQVRFRAQAELE